MISGECATSVEGQGIEGHYRRSACSVGDQDDLRSAREAERERFKQSSPKFETIHEMALRFVTCFKTLHTERECVAGVYVCVVCRSALTTLVGIRAAITKDPQGRRAILNNDTFMKLLVKLCSLNSLGGPNICTVSGQDVKHFYERRVYRSFKGTVRVLEDQHSEICWERFLGKAAKKIRTLTYAVSFQNARIPGGSSCVWHTREYKHSSNDELLNTPIAAPQKATLFPVSDVSSLDVSGVIDAQHLWVYNSSQAREDAIHLSSLLMESHQALLKCPSQESRPSVGDIAGLLTSSECLQRVLVLEVTENMAVVWSMDRGNFYRVNWSSLIGLLPSFKQLPPAVSLGRVQGKSCFVQISPMRWIKKLVPHPCQVSTLAQNVSAAPFLKLLRECVRVFRTVTHHNSQEGSFHVFMVTKLAHLGAVEVLADLLHCPDYETRMVTIQCLAQLCSRQRGRRLKRLLGRYQDNCFAMVGEEKLRLVDLVQAVFFRNEELMLEYADSDRAGDLQHSAAAQGQDGRVAIGGRFYLRDTVVPIALDNRHELRPLSNMRLASASTLAKLACSFLNTWRPCTVFYGISREGRVHGVRLNQRERDALRQGVDTTVSGLRPRLPPTLFSVEFVPVLRTVTEVRESASRFVVEVHVRGAPHTVYTTLDGDCYLRSGGQSYLATTFDVRAWVAQQEEARFLLAAGGDASRPLPTHVHPPSSRSWDKVVY
ncbi:hypothetical protein HPB48_006900 [Haemaphysalis longicornis]|uniref:Schlafen AlbA-2 domain-containing protein n=1 Tax=Haemaphysalis longicornis TaxID=44386 RepID=A0A9J6FE83_HAELO|nr:hypothetical protein HPB48_006900 [Haemaphysalis longicornis]